MGPHICILKTHVDIVEDFSAETAEQLRGLAVAHDFIIMEDRWALGEPEGWTGGKERRGWKGERGEEGRRERWEEWQEDREREEERRREKEEIFEGRPSIIFSTLPFLQEVW